jgi:hypothetical protein
MVGELDVADTAVSGRTERKTRVVVALPLGIKHRKRRERSGGIEQSGGGS